MITKKNRYAQFRGAATAEPAAEIDLDQLYQGFEETLARIDEGLESGDIDEDEADELDAQALEDYQALLAEAMGVELEDEDYDDDEGDYGDGTDLATFSTSSQLGTAVLELGQSQGYETVEDLVGDLSEATGYDAEDLAALITGQASLDDFEDPELTAHTLAQAFEVTAGDDDAYDGFMNIAAEESGYEIDDSGDDEVDYSRYRLDLERDRKIDTLEAQFTAAQEENAISQTLMELTREADLGYEEGWLPPAAYKAIVGEFEMDTDRFAAFSAVCDSNEVDPATELYAMQKQLEVFKRCGPFVKFGATVEEDLSPDEAEALQSVQASAKAYAKAVNAAVDL